MSAQHVVLQTLGIQAMETFSDDELVALAGDAITASRSFILAAYEGRARWIWHDPPHHGDGPIIMEMVNLCADEMRKRLLTH